MTLDQTELGETLTADANRLVAGASQDRIEHQAKVARGEAEAYIVDREGYFTSLPREYYISEEIFEKDIRKVFSKQWVYAGQLSQLKNPGDYYVRDIGPESMIISRGQDGELRALFNVCRHRGSRICKVGEIGNAKSFVCPYHQWTFGSDGALKSVPGTKNGDFFNFKDWSIEEAHIDVYHGAIFVYLDKEDPSQSLEDFLTPVTSDPEAMNLIRTDRTKIAARKVYDVPANWKTMLENNSECYHCPGSHPSLCAAVNVQATYLQIDGSVSPLSKKGQIYTFKPDVKTFAPSKDWLVNKPIATTVEGSAALPEGFNIGLAAGPNFCGIMWTSDYGIVIAVEPVDVGNSRLICEWLVHEDAVEGVDYELDNLMAMWDNTNREDIELATNNYLGTKSLRYSPGPNIPHREPMIRRSLVSYLDLFNAPE